MKAVQLLINSLLPEDLRDYERVYDAKSLSKLLAEVAEKYPEKYATIAKAIGDVGRKAAYLQGETLTLDDLKPVIDRDTILAQMDQEVDQARAEAKTDEEFKERRAVIWGRYSDDLEKATMTAALDQNNNLGFSVASGARGKAPQLKAMITTPGLYADYKENVIPMFVRRSFSEGLRPAEFLAGTFGARTSVLSTKRATADGGDLCLSHDTLVRMADFSTKKIRDIAPGELVLGCNKSGVTVPVRVVRKFDQGEKACRIYTLSRPGSNVDFHVTCTPAHKFLARYTDYKTRTREDVVPLGEMTTRWTPLFPKCFDSHGLKKEPFAFVLGAMVGDGSYTGRGRTGRMHYTCAEEELVQKMQEELAPLGLRLTQNKSNSIQFRVAMTSAAVRKSGDAPQHPLKAKLLELGVLGQNSHTKTTPKEISKWDNASVAAYLSGYLAADGCCTHNYNNGKKRVYLNFTSVSKSLLESVADLLFLRFGVFSSLFEQTADKRSGFAGKKHGDKSSYVLTVAGYENLKRFCAAVPCCGRKTRKLKEWLENRAPDKRDSLYAFSKIEGSCEAGMVHCFDIEVDHPDHLFVLGNGLVCSNSKLWTQIGSNVSVTEKDCGTSNGIDLDPSESSLRGRVLAADTAGIPAGTPIDRVVLKKLQNVKGKVLVRSPLTCHAGAGMCSKCFGLKMDGKLPRVGESIGIAAANALGEPVTQNALNSKHTAGQAKGKRTFSGFDVLDAFVQTPETFPYKADVAQADGRVTQIVDAPQGGKYVHVDDRRHYVQPGFEVFVKVGDQVEAGEQLADGVVDAYDIVRTRGLGEGRRYYAERLKQVLDDSGLAANLRNTEVLARGAIDHVVVDDADGIGDYLPDDIASYNRLTAKYVPPETTRLAKPDEGIGQYLQAPALHYSVGTKLTSRMAKRLKESGIANVQIDKVAPAFHPEMQRLRTASHSGNDWLVRMSTSYIKDNLSDSAVRGQDTDVLANAHWAPRLAYGVGFGEKSDVTGKF